MENCRIRSPETKGCCIPKANKHHSEASLTIVFVTEFSSELNPYRCASTYLYPEIHRNPGSFGADEPEDNHVDLLLLIAMYPRMHHTRDYFSRHSYSIWHSLIRFIKNISEQTMPHSRHPADLLEVDVSVPSIVRKLCCSQASLGLTPYCVVSMYPTSQTATRRVFMQTSVIREFRNNQWPWTWTTIGVYPSLIIEPVPFCTVLH